MKRSILSLFLLIFLMTANAQTKPSSCFTDVTFEKAFVAINTHQESNLVSWYQEVMGIKILKRFESEDRATVGVILQKEDLYVEILHSSKIKNGNKEQAGQRIEPGIEKVGIFVDKPVEELQTCLKQNGLNVGRIFHDREMGVKLLHLTDPEGNELEIISADTL